MEQIHRIIAVDFNFDAPVWARTSASSALSGSPLRDGTLFACSQSTAHARCRLQVATSSRACCGSTRWSVSVRTKHYGTRGFG